METLIVKIEEPQKAALLVQLLQSLDFVNSVDRYENFIKARESFESINKFSTQTELTELTTEDINAEIKAYRGEKRSLSN